MLLRPSGATPVLIESEIRWPSLCESPPSWGSRKPLFDAPPLRLTIRVQPGPSPEAPPSYQASADGFLLECDQVTRGEFSIRAHAACLHISRAVLDQPEWLRHHLLECLVLTALDTFTLIGLHALRGSSNGDFGVLLCGDSGKRQKHAGLCLRAGWTFRVRRFSSCSRTGLNIASGKATIKSRPLSREPARKFVSRNLLLRPLPLTAPNGKQCTSALPTNTLASAPARQCVFLHGVPAPSCIRIRRRCWSWSIMRYNTRYDQSVPEQRLREFVRGGTWVLEYEHLDDAIQALRVFRDRATGVSAGALLQLLNGSAPEPVLRKPSSARCSNFRSNALHTALERRRQEECRTPEALASAYDELPQRCRSSSTTRRGRGSISPRARTAAFSTSSC